MPSAITSLSIQIHSAFGAETQAFLPAQKLDGQGQQDLFHDQFLQVDLVLVSRSSNEIFL